jgi:predicted phosphodiesterase
MTQRPTLIAHLADLHLSLHHRRRNIRNVQRLLEYVQKLGVDHVVVTGDIAADALPEELDLARRLFEAYGLLDPSRLSVVIGNHDVYGGVHTAEDVLTFPGRCRTTPYGERVRHFGQAFRETFRGTLGGSPANPFPFLKTIGGVALLGMNSVADYSPVRNPVGSNGAVMESERDTVEEWLESGVIGDRTPIALIHHHFSAFEPGPPGIAPGLWGAVERQTMKLRGKKKLLKLFARHGIGLVLHGHVHLTQDYRRSGIRFLNAGGSLLGPVPGELTVNLLRIENSRVHVEVHHLPAAAGVVRRTVPVTSPLLSLETHEAA